MAAPTSTDWKVSLAAARPHGSVAMLSHAPLSFAVFKVVFYSLEGKEASMMKNGVFWVVTPCGSCKNRRIGGTWRLLHEGDKNR
jgi:hypothetical protein